MAVNLLWLIPREVSSPVAKEMCHDERTLRTHSSHHQLHNWSILQALESRVCIHSIGEVLST